MSVLVETIKSSVVQGVEYIAKQPWNKFTFENKVSPFTTNKEVFIGFCTYFIVIFGVQAIMRRYNIKPFQLKWLFFYSQLYFNCSFCSTFIWICLQFISNHKKTWFYLCYV